MELSLLTIFGNRNLVIIVSSTLGNTCILMILCRIVHECERACCALKPQLWMLQFLSPLTVLGKRNLVITITPMSLEIYITADALLILFRMQFRI